MGCCVSVCGESGDGADLGRWGSAVHERGRPGVGMVVWTHGFPLPPQKRKANIAPLEGRIVQTKKTAVPMMLARGIRFGFAKHSAGSRSGFAPFPGIRSCGGYRILWEKHTWSPRLPQPLFSFIILQGVIMSVGGGCCF